MTFNPPDLSQIQTNENEMNNRLFDLKQLVKDELNNLNVLYSDSDSVKTLIGKISNIPSWLLREVPIIIMISLEVVLLLRDAMSIHGTNTIRYLIMIQITGIFSHWQPVHHQQHGDSSILVKLLLKTIMI